MLVSAPYSQAYAASAGKEDSLEEKPAGLLYSAFTRGRKAVVQDMYPYAAYAKEGLDRSKKLAKQGYCYSSQGVRYSYKKGKDGLGYYYAKIPKERMVPILKENAENIASFRALLPVPPQINWLSYLENLMPAAVSGFDNALGVIGMCLEQNSSGDILSVWSEHLKKSMASPFTGFNKALDTTGTCSEQDHMRSIADFPTVLPVLAQSAWLRYLGRLTTSQATKFDKALDARYLQNHLGGYNHRLFDGRHTIGGAWTSVAKMCAETGCSNKEQLNGYVGSLWKDATTPKGLPFFTMEKQTYDSLASKLSKYGISKRWTYDALSYDALEVLAAGISAVAVVYFLKTGQIEELSETLAAMEVVSIASANPLLALVMVSSVAYAIATGTGLDVGAAVEGIVKSSIISGTLVLLPGMFLLQIAAAVAIALLLEETMKDENYAFVEEFAMEKINELGTWIPDIQGEENWMRVLYGLPKSMETRACLQSAS